MPIDEGREPQIVTVAAERLDVRRPGEKPKADSTVVVLHEPVGAAAEHFRSLYYSLRRANGGGPLGVLAVVSAARGEGRSTIAANLAAIAARETGRPTALVDADLRGPTLHRLMGMDGEVGLSDVLANRADLEAVTWELDAGELTFVPGGRPEAEPARRFLSPRFQRFLAQMRHRFDEVVMDLPPLACADARLLAPQCNGALFVIRSGYTEEDLAKEAVASLDGVKLLGATLNDASEGEVPALRAARRALPGRK